MGCDRSHNESVKKGKFGMYLHLGEKTVVNTKYIVGIFDIENTSVSKDTRDFLRDSGEKHYQVVNVSYEMPKSFIVCNENGRKGKDTVYISQISAATLRKRLEAAPARIKTKQWNSVPPFE